MYVGNDPLKSSSGNYSKKKPHEPRDDQRIQRVCSQAEANSDHRTHPGQNQCSAGRSLAAQPVQVLLIH